MRLCVCIVGTAAAFAALFSHPAHARITFTDPAPLNSNAATDSGHDFLPRIASDNDDTYVVVWSSDEPLGGGDDDDTDIIFSRSTNDGASWSDVANLNNGADDDSDEDDQPDVAAGGSTWVVVWTSEKDAGAGDDVDTDIFFARSTNGGATWSNSAPIHANEAADGFNSDNKARVATDGEGNWVCVWSSTAPLTHTGHFDQDIVFSRSTDDGVTWTAPAHLNSNAANATGADYNPFVRSNGAGGWIVVWTSTDALNGSVSDDPEIMVSYSTNDAATWSNAAFLNSDHATDQSDDPIGNDSNPTIANLSEDEWLVTWDRVSEDETNLGFVSRTTDGGQTWSAAKPIELVPADGKAGKPSFSQFYSYSYGLGTYTSHRSDYPWDNYPQKGGSGNDYDIRFNFSPDGGKTWTDGEFINNNAFTDSGDDDTPVTAGDADGNIVIVWSSLNTLNNTIGSDADFLFSRGSVAKLTELTKPNGGEKWRRGKKQKIEWVSNLDASEKVRLDLYRNGNKVQTIKNATPNDGLFKWKVPNSVSKGGKYRVRITLKSDTSVQDLSLYTFNVK